MRCSSGEMVWKEMEDWKTLAHKEVITYKQLPALQVRQQRTTLTHGT